MLAWVVVGFFFFLKKIFFENNFIIIIISIYGHLLQKNNENADTMAC